MSNIKCEVRPSDFMEFVKLLYKADPQKYRNFDSVANFILGNPMIDEDKKVLAVFNSALIYTQLDTVSQGRYNLGKANEILGIKPFLNDSTAFLKEAGKLYMTNESSLTQASINKAIAELGKNGSVIAYDLKNSNGIFAMIEAYLKNQSFKTAEDKTTATDELFAALISRIESLDNGSSIPTLLREVTVFRTKFARSNMFQTLRQIAEAAGLNTYLIRMKDGQVFEASIHETTQNFVVKNPDGSVTELAPENIQSSELALSQEQGRYSHNGFQHVFFQDTIDSGLKIIARQGQAVTGESYELRKLLEGVTDPASQMEVALIPVSKVSSDRVGRIQELASQDPAKYSSLAFRNHETFESSEQENFLLQNPGSKVLTLGRPKDGFILQVTLKTGETPQVFNLYGFNNYVFVHANNKTESVDFTNPEHLKEVQRLSVNRNNKNQTLTDEEIARMSASQRSYNEFISKAAATAQDGTVQDVTSLFFEHFKLEKEVVRKTEFLQIAEDPEGGKLLFPVKVAKLRGEDVDPESYEDREIVIFLSKAKNDISFRINSTIASDEVIILPETGESISMEHYVKYVLGLEEDQIEAMFKDKATFNEATNVLIRRNEDGSFGYRKTSPKNAMEHVAVMMTYVSSLAELMLARDPKKNREFERGKFTWKIHTPSTLQNGSFFVSHSESKSGKLQIEMRPKRGLVRKGDGTSSENRYFQIFEDPTAKSIFNFELDEAKIMGIHKSLTSSSLITKIKEQYPALKSLDLGKTEDVTKFFEFVEDEIRTGNATTEMVSLRDKILTAMDGIARELGDRIIQRFSELEASNPELYAMLKEDYSVNGEFRPDFLAVDQVDGKSFLKVAPHGNNSQGREAYFTDPSNFRVMRTSRGSASVKFQPTEQIAENPVAVQNNALAEILAKHTTGEITVEPGAVTVQEPVTPTVADTPAGQQLDFFDTESNWENDAVQEVGFELQNGEVVTESRMMRDAAIEWVNANYAQFGIQEGDIKELLGLIDMDANVLGAFRNKVIYLDSKILGAGTVYHEAFHGVFRHLFTQSERDMYRHEVKSDPKNASRFSQQSVLDFIAERNFMGTLEQAADLIAEEILAEGFQRFMKSGRKPKQGFLARVFEALKNLLKMFRKNGSQLDNMFDAVARGQYSSRVLESGMFENQTAFELIPALSVATSESGRIKFTKDFLGVGESKQVINRMASLVVNDTSKKSFDEKFENAAKKVINENYSLEKLILQNPAKEREIRERFERTFNNIRFVLGGRKLGMTINDINLTGDPRLDNMAFRNNAGKTVDTGDAAVEIMKRKVAEAVGKLTNLYDVVEMDKEEIENEPESIPGTQLGLFDEGVQSGVVPDGDELSEDEVGENFNESTLAEYNAMDSLNREIRRLISSIEVQTEISDLGITMGRMIDPQAMFGMLLKITAGVAPAKIVDQIKKRSEIMREDGYSQSAEELDAFYREINNLLRMSEQGTPTENGRLYHMLIDVLHGTEMDYVMLKIDSFESEERGFGTGSYTIRDRVFTNDQRIKKRELMSKIATVHSSRSATDSYQKAASKLKTKAVSISTSQAKSPVIYRPGMSKVAVLRKEAHDIHALLQEVGLEFPKSLIEMSLLAIDRDDNGINFDQFPELKSKLESFAPFISEGKFLDKSFFASIGTLMDAALSSNNNVFQAYLSDTSSISDTTMKTLNGVLEKAAGYILTMNPTKLPSVIKNAERKSIYRYTKYTPIQTMIRDIKEKGLHGMLSTDPYYESYLKDFISDNPYLDPENERNAAFLANMKMALFGGVQQTINNDYAEGKSFKDLDDRTLFLSYLLAFMQRDEHVYMETVMKDGIKTREKRTVQTFMRPFSQLEASQSNFLVTGRYMEMVNKDGMMRTNEGNLKMSALLKSVIKQEFNRMQRVYNSRHEMKEEFDSQKGNRIVKDFNGTVSKNQFGLPMANVEPSRVDKNGNVTYLRAYQFNKLQDLFGNPENTAAVQIADELREAAFSGKTFEEAEAGLTGNLMLMLDGYVHNSVNNHIARVKALGLISEIENPGAGELYGPYKSISSDFIGDKMRIGNNSGLDWTSYYGNKKVQSYQLTEDFSQDILAPDYENLITDAYLNMWANGILFNDIFDGDVGMSVKNPVDYIKRNKKHLAAGSNMKEGFHKVAYADTITAFLWDAHPELGEFYSVDEIINASWVPLTLKDEMIERFKSGKDRVKSFDGQSVSSIMHQMDQFETLGRLAPEAVDLLIAKHYRKLTTKEQKLLKSLGIVMNSKKTVTSGRHTYHKLSEVHIDRADSSMLVIPEGMTRQDVHDELHAIYSLIYTLRKDEQGKRIAGETDDANRADARISELYRSAHAYFRPLKHRAPLHNLINSMEAYNIDQMMDTEASKNSTLLPIPVDRDPGNGYNNLGLSSLWVENQYKYNQVETSGVKKKASFSVQSKALLPADIGLLGKLMAKAGVDVNNDIDAQIALAQTRTLLTEYQESLREAAQRAFDDFKLFNKSEGSFEIKTIFNLIRESLQDQDGALNKIKLFDLDEKGEPVYDYNLPVIRHMLEYYFFSQYSKITDEKGAGFKNIHISSFGYNVLQDTVTGKVITTEDYKKDPGFYEGRVISRPLKVDTEVNNGVKTHWVEVIMPKPDFKSRAEEKFWMDRVSKMFGTRIPTEDKRSMIAMKVVDFIDSSNATGIIVPQIVHLLSGSDLDVDALYGHMKATYQDLTGAKHVFGDRPTEVSDERSLTQQEAAFREWVFSAINSKDVKKLVAKKKLDLRDEFFADPENFHFSHNTIQFLRYNGLTEEDLEMLDNYYLVKAELEDPSVAGLNQEIKDLNQEISELMSAREESREALDKSREYSNQIKSLRALIDDDTDQVTKDTIYEQIAALEKDLIALQENVMDYRILSADLRERIAEKKQIEKTETLFQDMSLYELNNTFKKMKGVIKMAVRAESILSALKENNLPVSVGAFTKAGISEVTVEAAQNRNLDAKLGILSNDTVFNHLYVKERSSVQAFEDLTDDFGIEIGQIGSNLNMYTTDSIIAAKITTQMNKTGIEITASLNKTLALASQYVMELKDEEVIWDYKTSENDANGNPVRKRLYEFGSLNEENIRTINLIGNILGMFADGAKKPIPAALRMNEINAGISLNMIGMGMDPAMAMAFNFIPEIAAAVNTVASDKTAVGTSISASVKQFSGALTEQLDELLKKEEGVLDELISAGLVGAGSYARRMKVVTKNLQLDYTKQKMGHSSIFRTDMKLTEIGFKVSARRDKDVTATPISESAQKAMLLAMYIQQVKQTNQVRKAGAVINMFKKLNPNFVSFDAAMSNIETFRNPETSVFKPEGIERVFADNQVWPVLLKVMRDLEKEASKLFLERGDFFRSLTTLFSTAVTDSSVVAKTVTSFVALNLFKQQYPGSRIKPGMTPEAIDLIKEEDEIFKDVMDPSFWYANTLGTELEQMKERYPDNLFLTMLSEKQVEQKDPVTQLPLKNVPNVRFIEAKVRLDVSADEVTADYEKLLLHSGRQERLFARKLFFHELVRTGLNHTPNSFMSFLSVEQLKPVTDQMKKFTSMINRDMSAFDDMNSAFEAILGTDSPYAKLVFFNDLYLQMARFTIKDASKVRLKVPFDLSLKSDKKGDSKLMRSVRQNLSVDAQKEIGEDDAGTKAVRKIAAGVIDQVFEKKFAEGRENFPIFELNSNRQIGSTPNTVSENGQLVFNFNSGGKAFEKVGPRVLEALGSIYGIEALADGLFAFPVMIRTANGYLLLSGVDDNSDNQYAGEALMNSVRAENPIPFTNIGKRARYQLIDPIPVPEQLSPLAFNTYDNAKFRDIAGGAMFDELVDNGQEMDPSELLEDYSQSTGQTIGTTEDMDEDFGMEYSDDMLFGAPEESQPARTESALPDTQPTDEEGPSNMHLFQGLLGGTPTAETTEEQVSEETPLSSSELGILNALMGMSDAKTGVTALVSTPASPLVIYTDGSDFKGSGQMGYGATFELNGKWFTLSGTEQSAAYAELQSQFPSFKFSNNTMELMGMLEALRSFEKAGEHLEMVTDNKLAINWGPLWSYSEGSPQREAKPFRMNEPYIAHLVAEIAKEISKIEANGGSVKLRWVKGHNGTMGNEIADQAAKNREITENFSSAVARIQQLIQKINANQFDQDTLKSLYNLSSKRKSLDEFTKTAMSMIDAQRDVRTLGEIIDQIKCL